MTSPGDLAAGDRIGRYRLVDVLGVGGMGQVWQAVDGELEREVAVKVLSGVVRDQASRLRFAREARILARLQHPNVVCVHDVGTAEVEGGRPMPYLVMERIEGESLARIFASGPLAPARALRILHQVALALGAAHDAGVIHRDLKPSNVMVMPDGMVKVLDFGLARAFETEQLPSEDTLTQPGAVVGSCSYMAPEQALGDEVTPAADVFAFGALLYEALAGRRAFTGANPMAILRAVASVSYPPLAETAPDLPPLAADLVERCLQRQPEQRYRDGASLADAVRRLEDEERTRALTPNPPSQGPAAPEMSPGGRRRSRLGPVAIGLGAVAVALMVWMLAAWWGDAAPPHPGAWQLDEIAASGGILDGPAWTVDGRSLLVVERIRGRAELIRLPAEPAATSEVVMRAAAGEVLGRPRPSPSGRRLALMVVRGGELTIHAVPLGRAGPPTVVERAFNPAWLDDNRLAFARTDAGRTGLFVRDLESGRESPLIEAEADRSFWQLLPSSGGAGPTAFVAGAGEFRSGVWVGRGFEPSAWQNWLPEGSALGGASWAPSGRSLAAAVDGQLVRLSADGVAPLLPSLVDLRNPALSPEGDRLAVVRRRQQWDLMGIDPESGERRCIQCGEDGAGWGSVGTTGAVVFRRQTPGGGQLVLRSLDGGRQVVSAADERPSCPSLSPQGDRVAYLAAAEGGPELRVRPVAGGPPVVLASDVEPSEFPSWSPDGDQIVYAGGAPLRIHVAHVAESRVETLPPGVADYPSWSPDGRWIAYSVWTSDEDPDQGLWVIRPDGTGQRQVSRWPTRAAWRPDGAGLWQLRTSPDGLEIWWAAVEDWQWRRFRVVDLGESSRAQQAYRPITVNPVTGELVLAVERSGSSLLLFSGLDPARW